MRAARATVALAAMVVLLAPTCAGAAGVFDNLILSPRARAMGGAFVAVSDDETAIFTNPAGLAQQQNVGFYGSYVDLYGYDFLDLASFAATMPTNKGTFAVGGRLMSVQYKGVDLETEYSIALGHGFTVMEDVHSSLSFGYALSLYGLSFDAESVGGEDLGSASTFGVDIGVMGTLRGRTSFGFFAKNVNNPKLGDPDAEDLPQWFTAGVSYSPYGGVHTNLEMQKQDSEELRTCFGLELEITDYVTLRGGLQNQPNRLSVGFGTHWEALRVDYSFTSHATLPGSHHFGLGVAF
ncbi:MAG: hypothetical protein ABIG03_03360 [Candidatus Eisenbacteria bacterium]